MSNFPDYKPNFKYTNLGNCVGMLTYVSPLVKKESGQQYGHEFLIFAKGQGSINVRVPKLEKSQAAVDNFPLDPNDKPHVRLGLTSLSQFVTEQGKVYTQLTSFLDMEEGKTKTGDVMPPTIKGRFGGEVFNIQDQGSVIKFHAVSYPLNKEGNRSTLQNGTFVDPDVVQFEIHNPEIINQFRAQVQQGANIEVGYSYINKDDVTYDEFGMPVGSGERMERIEVGRLIVHGQAQNNGPVNNGAGHNPFQQQGQNQQQNPFGGQQQNPFGQQQNQQQQQQQNYQQQGQQNPSYGNQSTNPFNPQSDPLNHSIQQDHINQQNGQQNGQQNQQNNPFGQQLPPTDPMAMQANQLFGQNGQMNGGQFPFGQ